VLEREGGRLGGREGGREEKQGEETSMVRSGVCVCGEIEVKGGGREV